MISEATKELIALANVLCGGLIFLVLLAYLVFSRQRQLFVVLFLLLVTLLCVVNAFLAYFLL